MLIIGKIVKAQGIKGEVKIIPITDDVLRFNKLKKATVKGQEMTVESSRVQNDCAYVKFKGVDTRNDAELLQNEYVSVAREDAVKLPENTWFIDKQYHAMFSSKTIWANGCPRGWFSDESVYIGD